MTKLYHSPLMNRIKEYIRTCDSNQTLFFFVPYIKTPVLENMIQDVKNKIVIVTTWKPYDLLQGSSELELYPFCQQNNIALYVSENLHLKVYSVGLANAILATGNISQRGMRGGNYEAAVMIENLTNEDRLFFSKIRHEARLIDDEMYKIFKEWCEKHKTNIQKPLHFSDVVPELKTSDFSVASLPMTRSVDDLISGYKKISTGLEPSEDAETNACIFHDLANYNIGLGMSEGDFINELTLRFFEHPFIQKIDEFISPEVYFGRIKEWIQNNCTDVPVPSRRELTANVQVLLEWFARLNKEKYIVDIPGKRSQRIRNIKYEN